MKIIEAIDFFKHAEKSTEKKSQKKHYQTFIAILTDLQSKELDTNQFLLIEKKLDDLQFNTKLSFKQLHRNFSKLQQFLKVKFLLTEEGHYTSLGIAIGMCLGIAFGALIERYIGASIGMTTGMLIGVAIGKTMDSRAEVHGRALKKSFNS